MKTARQRTIDGHKKARKDTKVERRLSPSSAASTRVLLFVFLCAFSWLANSDASAQGTLARKDPASALFESEIAAFEKWDRQNAFPKHSVLFVGSSSIRLWQTAEAFPDLPVINRGFGGSSISDVNHFFDRIVLKYKPRVIVFYSGDNDIADGKSPRQVYDDFAEFVRLVRDRLGKTPIYFISIKPSIARLRLWPKMKEANTFVQRLAGISGQVVFVDVASPMFDGKDVPARNLFLEDGLHLNAAGYELWNKTLAPALK